VRKGSRHTRVDVFTVLYRLFYGRLSRITKLRKNLPHMEEFEIKINSLHFLATDDREVVT
jgi:hypothetical protein